MKTVIYLAIAILFSFFFQTKAQNKWKAQPINIQTRWFKEVSPNNALNEYPRPQMVREKWINLNGLWDYAITPKDSSVPLKPEGQILVPYPIESALSGVKKSLKPDQNLWYMKKITTPTGINKNQVLLHFGAVDYQATIYIDGIEVGMHEGGYTSFSFDITKFLTKKIHTLFVKVYDPTDKGVGPHGKQLLNPDNIYYTSSSGIWQTVWMEIVPANYIQDISITPDIDKSLVYVNVKSAANTDVELKVQETLTKGKTNTMIAIPIKNIKLWSPSKPHLYGLKAKLAEDAVKSYFGMRKVSIAKDEEGVDRIFLNNKPYFNLGVLDQGFWPDGLYTAPTDEALAFDIKAIKAMGFNTIRKHIKIEPARWYYYADKLGMLVWQDMVNPNQGLPEGSKAAFEAQVRETVQQLHNHPSITTWVLFNEKWGQYDQGRLTKWIKEIDPSRIVNGHSGELLYVDEQLRSPAPNAYINSDMTDVHSYPDPMMSIKQDGKAQVVGEFGGIGVFIGDHQWNPEIAWGYIQEKPAALKLKYAKMNELLNLQNKQGLGASIYTQPFDVESEQNGLMTYDREVIKIPFKELRNIHRQLNPDLGKIPQVAAENADLTDPEIIYHRLLAKYKNEDSDRNVIRKLLLMSDSFKDTINLRKFAAKLTNVLKQPYDKKDLQLVMKLTKVTNDPGFDFLFKNSDSINAVLGANAADGKIISLIDKEIVLTIDPNASIYVDPWEMIAKKPSVKVDWDKIKRFIETKYGNLGIEAFYKAQGLYLFYKTSGDHAALIPTYSKLMDFLYKEYQDKAGIRVGGMILNNIAWSIFEVVTDTVLLNKALRWSRFSIEEWPENYQRMDTYANLLYKLGRVREAIEWETKAMGLMEKKEQYRYRSTIEKMEKGIKTWPDK